jgi:hypothetical protein
MSLLDAAGVVTGDIWCTGAFSFESPLKDLLDSGEYTLEQLLEEDELLQELRGIHPQLLEFFSTEEAVAGLIQYVILPPDAQLPQPILVQVAAAAEAEVVPSPIGDEEERQGGDDEEKQEANDTDNKKAGGEEDEENRNDPAEEEEDEDGGGVPTQQLSQQEQTDMVYVRFPYVACEVICCEINGIIDTIVDGFLPTDEQEESVVANEEKDENEGGDAEVTLKHPPRPKNILDLLFSLLYDSKAGEIDDYRAGYFDKLLSVLFRKRPQAMSQYVNVGGGKGNEALMKAMFKHLYSHSIMQIVQRLLLPQPPLPPRGEDDQDGDGEGLYVDSLEGANDLDGMGCFRCNWSESQVALDLLLDCLIGPGSAPPDLQDEDERLLSLCQNASEVLITIIQNSPLTSPTLKTLTTDPVMEKLIVAGSFIQQGADFSPHDSKVTCTMNVLESLILQLGGYGSVGTVVLPEEEEDEEASEGVEVQDGRPPSHPLDSTSQRPEMATSDTLIKHLPMMLDSLCNLLLHPSAEDWLSPMQFSKTEPQHLLGSSRLRIVRLLESLVLLGDANVDAILCESNCLEICLDLFWKFQWCSMLHQSVANLLVHVFEGANARSELQSYFMIKCNLLGRLMDSFWDANEDGSTAGQVGSVARLSEVATAMTSIGAPTSSVGSERGSLNSSDSVGAAEGNKDDVIPVSDDDVDAAMEQQDAAAIVDKQPDENNTVETESYVVEQVSTEAVAPESRDSAEATILGEAPVQPFRLGYMGHVIIICQALVHACTNDGEKSETPSMAEEDNAGEPRPEMNGDFEEFVDRLDDDDDDEQVQQAQKGSLLEDSLDRGRASDSQATDETGMNPLILAQLVEEHPLKSRWQEFVSTTLASETAIQSTPLGGFLPGPGSMDPLHAHRPGSEEEDQDYEEDDDDDDDDGAAQPPPQRGLLVGGDVIDMDDNDLDIAASMMAGLSLGRTAVGSENSNEHPDLLAGIPREEDRAQAGSYMFDDPLGDGRFGRFDEDEDDDSSDEDSEQSGATRGSGNSGGALSEGVSNDPSGAENEEAPVMDLFAGNFEAFDDKQAPANGDQGTWSNFANFDDAFAAESGTSPFDNNNPAVEESTSTGTPNDDVDEFFGGTKDHAILLDEPEPSPGSEDKSTEEAVATDVKTMEEADDEEPVTEENEDEPASEDTTAKA